MLCPFVRLKLAEPFENVISPYVPLTFESLIFTMKSKAWVASDDSSLSISLLTVKLPVLRVFVKAAVFCEAAMVPVASLLLVKSNMSFAPSTT